MVGRYVAEVIKRWKFAPQLSVDFELGAPFCHKTRWRPRPGGNVDYDEPVYYCRFRVKNTGKTQARSCEALLEELWIYDSSGRPQPFPNFSAVHLKWVGSQSKFEDINPDRRSVYCDIGYVSSRTYQDRYESRAVIDVPGRGGNDLRFVLELRQVFYSQPSCLVPGKYLLGVALYAENAACVRLFFEVTWSGRWQDTEPEMFRELVIQKISAPPSSTRPAAA